MPLQRTQTAKGVSALAALLRRRAKATADRARLDSLMEQVARLRESGECSAEQFDQAGATYLRSALAIAQQGA